jgi:serine/threonine protein kinase
MEAKNVGDRVGGFTVLDVVHNGNFSSVFKVRNDENDIFALKTIQYSKNESKEERESLIESAKRETQIGIMSGISSPFLVKYYKIFNDGATFCILMEFCGGGMLEDKIQKRKDENRFFSEEVCIFF